MRRFVAVTSTAGSLMFRPEPEDVFRSASKGLGRERSAELRHGGRPVLAASSLSHSFGRAYVVNGYESLTVYPGPFEDKLDAVKWG